MHQRPGIVHYLSDYSADMEYLEIVSPADFKTVEITARNRGSPTGDALEVMPWT